MAKRKRKTRGLGGTTEQHRHFFGLRITAAQNAAKVAMREARSGNCEDALHWFRRAAENEGAASAHFENLPSARVSGRDIEKMGVASADLNKAERVVRSCKRKR